MKQFIAGLILGLSAVTAVALFWFRRKKNDKQQPANDHLCQIEQLSKLTGEIAHEIKNPLSTVKVNLQLVSEELEDAKRNVNNPQKIERSLRKINVIGREIARVEQILDGFLRYVNIVPPQLISIDINQLMEDMLDFYTPQAHSHKITIRHTFYNQPLICKIDQNMLRQAILNLFINAQQAMPQGGELIVKTDKADNNAVILIGDTGSGIPQEKLPHLFDTYYSSRPQGSGLGLPTTKKIIDANKGQITLTSEPGKGTLFTIQLPLYNHE